MANLLSVTEQETLKGNRQRSPYSRMSSSRAQLDSSNIPSDEDSVEKKATVSSSFPMDINSDDEEACSILIALANGRVDKNVSSQKKLTRISPISIKKVLDKESKKTPYLPNTAFSNSFAESRRQEYLNKNYQINLAQKKSIRSTHAHDDRNDDSKRSAAAAAATPQHYSHSNYDCRSKKTNRRTGAMHVRISYYTHFHQLSLQHPPASLMP